LIPLDICALQMKAAIEDVVLKTNNFPSTWAEAQKRHQKLYTENTHDLQIENPN